MNSYTVFPDIVFAGTLPLDTQIKTQLINDVKSLSDSGSKIETNYGWVSNKDVPVSGSLRKLQLLLGRTFTDLSKKTFGEVKHREIMVVQPHIIQIKPMHTYDLHINHAYWYHGCIWLQATDKGNHLFLETPTAKRYSTPPAYQPHEIFEQAVVAKYVCWPSHLAAGFTPNLSMVDSIIFNFGITSRLINTRK